MIRLFGQLQRDPLRSFRYRTKHLFQFDIGSDPTRPCLKCYSFRELIAMHPKNRHEIITWLYRQTQAYRFDVDRTKALTEIFETRNPERQKSRDLYVLKLYEDIERAVA